MTEDAAETRFASAFRLNMSQLMPHHSAIIAIPIIKQILDSMPTKVLILNKERQILFANRAFLEFLDLNDMDELLGLRHGETLNCVHSNEMKGGCGTSESCSTCGAAISILMAIDGIPDSRECRIIRNETCDPDALDLRVWACPMQIGESDYILLSVEDIGDEKRRKALERIFFHDVLNSAGALSGLLDTLKEADAELLSEYWETLTHLSQSVVDEIKAQRQLSAAESGDLTLNIQRIDAAILLRQVKANYVSMASNNGITLEASVPDPVSITTDPVILSRIIGNMLKNAIEANPSDKKVSLGYTVDEKEIVFFVRNRSYIPRDSQLQIFQRSFSTKGTDRGLGTYSIRLLCEKYLGGRVWFTSDEIKGTSFYAALPLKDEIQHKSD